jgi:TonB family protein
MNLRSIRPWVCVALLFSLSSVLVSSQAVPVEDSAGSRKVTTKVAPQYPALCRTLKISGSVKVEALVAPNGTVKSLEVKGGHPVLAEAAQNAVRQWKWEAAAHETHESIELRFNP